MSSRTGGVGPVGLCARPQTEQDRGAKQAMSTRFAATLSFVVAALAITGCGSSAPLPTSASAAPSTTTATTAPQTMPQTTSATPGITIDVTDPQGWHYSDQLPYPDYAVTFSKDVSSSPPGQAVLSGSLAGSVPTPTDPTSTSIQIADDNPGRPNGPTLNVTIQIAYSLKASDAANNVDLGVCNTIAGAYQTDPNDGFAQGFPFAATLRCVIPALSGVSTSSPLPSSGNSSVLPERTVDALVAELSGQQPIYVIGTQSNLSCNVFVSGSGTAKRQQGYDAARCGKVTVTATD
jgi:hypothetical protein